MQFPNKYNCLLQNEFELGEYKIVPIRFQDREDIMLWRNEQMYHLRQSKPLTQEFQNNYFEEVLSNLFIQEKPSQILFSYLKNGVCIGYGGLVHINWLDKNAEISFIMNTELEDKEFELHWLNYLKLIEQIGFKEINMHKLFIYAFDVRQHLYHVLEKANYREDAILTEHCFFNNKFLDVVIHSKINS